jgi:hypothetical protein
MNGNLDPWSAGGVLTAPSAGTRAHLIDKSAHHFDLRSSNDLDPQSVKDARALEDKLIGEWITAASQ